MSGRFDYEKIDVVDFLHSLGVQNIRDVGYEVMYSCPFDHSRGDVNPSASMSKVTIVKDNGDEYPPTTFNCFGCGKAGTAVSFLSEYEGISVLQARRTLREKYGMSFREPEEGLYAEILSKIGVKSPTKVKITAWEQPEVSETELTKRAVQWILDPPAMPIGWRKYMLDRGFKPEVLNAFMVGYDQEADRVTIPIFDERDRLVGFKGRAWREDQNPKYLPLSGENFEPYEMSKVLYALPKYITSYQPEKVSGATMIVTEGELNAIAMHQMGWDNTVGISGQFLSEVQSYLIIKYAQQVVLIFDDMNKAQHAASKLERHIGVSIVPERSFDPADILTQELETSQVETVLDMLNSRVTPYVL